MFESMESAALSQQISNSIAANSGQEPIKFSSNHTDHSLNDQRLGCDYSRNDKVADNMLQLLAVVNKVNGSQPLNLDRNDISLVVDEESFCVKRSGNPRWQCNVCPKYYSTKNSLITHLLSHYGAKPFACSVCNKSFNQATRLRFHMLSHKGKRPYICSTCQRSFTQMIHLKRHVLTHENKQPYYCKTCAKGFALQSELQSHLQLHKKQQVVNNEFLGEMLDKEEEPVGDLKCNLCGRKFLFPSQMKDHMLSHTQVRRFECSVCSMKFLKVHHLKSHCLTHSNLRAHKCNHCNRSFTLKGNLIRHLLTHTKERKFECEICCKRFSQRQTLKTHMVMHAETKPFSCPVCGKALARAHNLKSHMALHRSEKPYKCPLCNSGFTMKGNLHRHYKEKHKPNLKTTLNLDVEKTNTTVPLSSQYFASSRPSQIARMENESKFDATLNFSAFEESELEFSKKRKKPSSKKQKFDRLLIHRQQHNQPQQHNMLAPHQHPQNGEANSAHLPISMHNDASHPQGGFAQSRKIPLTHLPTAACSLAATFPDSVLHYCNDISCACKFQGQIGYSHHLMHKLHSLHTAIDTLALSSGKPNEQVSALHMAIDEMASLSQQKQTQQNNAFC